MRWFKRWRSKDPEPERGDPEPEFLDLLADYGLAALERQAAFENLVGDPDWELLQDSGVLRLGEDHVLPAQVLGSESEASWTWLWAWANDSVDAPLTAQARAAREVGVQRGIASLTDAQVDLDQVIGGAVVALAVAGALNADAFYRCPYPGGAAYVLVELAERPPLKDRSTAQRTIDLITRALTEMPALLTRRSIEAYVGQLGATIEQVPDGFRVDDHTTFEFNEDGFLKAYHTTLKP